MFIDPTLHRIATRQFHHYLDDVSKSGLDVWVAYGPPDEVIGKIREFADARAKEITLRITSFDQRGQYGRLTREVIPAFQRIPVT